MLKLGGQELILNSTVISVANLDGEGLVSGLSGRITAVDSGNWNATLTGSLSSISFSGTTTLSGAYTVPTFTVLSGAKVVLNQNWSPDEGGNIGSATRLSGNLTVQSGAIVQVTSTDNIERGLSIGGNLTNNGLIR